MFLVTHPPLTVRKRILVIENLPEVIPQLLRVDGHLAMSRNDVEGANELWNKAAGGFDVVVIDDRTGGQALIPHMLSSKPNLKIIFMTAKPEEHALPGNVVVLRKPVLPKRLAEAVNHDG